MSELFYEKPTDSTVLCHGSEDGITSHINEKHGEEWLKSFVDPEIINLSVKSLTGDEPYSRIIPDINAASKRSQPDAQWRWARGKYSHVEAGGWWCSGVDLLTGEDSHWGCFKPDQPRKDFITGKTIKYEHPIRQDTEVFALKFPVKICEIISRRYDAPLPSGYESMSHGELWEWARANKIPLIITEGAKKAGALLSLGYLAIGLPGIYSGFRQEQNEYGEKDGRRRLIPQLRLFAAQGQRIYFCFDQDAKWKTRRAVNNAITQTGKLFKFQGCNVNVITWSSAIGKGIDDVIAACGVEKFDELYRCALDFDTWQSHQLRTLTYKPDLELNQRYLEEFNVPAKAQQIFVRSAKSTGKTEWAGWFTDPVIRSGEKKVLVITHRRATGRSVVERLGVPWRDEIQGGVGTKFGMGLCIDSLHPKSGVRFNPDDWKGCWIVLDEIKQLIWHLLDSSTCKKERVSIIKTFQQLLRNCVKHGGKIIAMDADLDDTTIQFLETLIGSDVERFLVVNEYKFDEPWKTHIYNSKDPGQLIKDFLEALERGEKCILHLSGQQAKSKWGSRNIEAFIQEKMPHKKGLRIDSETVADPKHPAFGCTTTINKVLEEGQYDYVIATPTIETGVSIKAGNFDGVWGIFQGVQPPDSVRQNLSRYRPPVPRYIWIRPIGINSVGCGATSVKGMLAAEHKKNSAHIKQLNALGYEETTDSNFEPICLTTWAKMAASINLGMKEYKKQILQDLEEEGHTIIHIEQPTDSDEPEDVTKLKEEIKQVRDIQYEAHKEEVTEASSIDDDKFKELSKKQSKTKEERLEFQKGQLERSYKVPVTPDLVEKDDAGWYSKIQLHYYFQSGREFLPDREKGVMSSALENGNGDYFKPDTNKSFLWNKVHFLDWIGIERLFQHDRYHDNHPIIKDIFTKCKERLYDTKLATGLNFYKEKFPIRLVQRIAALIGLKLPSLGRSGSGDRSRYYGRLAVGFETIIEETEEGKPRQTIVLDDNGNPVVLSDDREKTFTEWIERDKSSRLRKEKAEQEAAQLATTHEAVEEYQGDPWLSPKNLESIAGDLEICEDPETLGLIRSMYPDYALIRAAKLLSLEKKMLIKAWVEEQNAA